MANYASGKRSKAISDRSGMEFPYKEMVREWNGSLVHISEFEPKQPQLEPKPHGADAISLQHVRTDRTEPITTVMIPENGFKTYQAGSGVINVNVPGHGLTNGTTYLLRKQIRRRSMIRSIGIAVIITVCMLWGFSALMNSAIADVTGAGSTTNTQSTSGSSATNTAITGGYHSEATTNYQSGSSSLRSMWIMSLCCN
jgi:hypothetical protein